MDIGAELEKPFGDFRALLLAFGEQQADAEALADSARRITWGELSATIQRIAAQLVKDGLEPGQAVAILGASNVDYALVYLAAILAGGSAAPLTTSASAAQLEAMHADCGARHLFIDVAKYEELKDRDFGDARMVMLGEAQDGVPGLNDWMAPEGTAFKPAPAAPDNVFNIIYSSGTTGNPKGIVHAHGMRWHQMAGGFKSIYSTASRTICATPLYSNTTLAAFLPTVCHGGFARIMEKFDAEKYLAFAEADRTTHTMLVPAQYQRIMALENFDSFDLSSFVAKFSTSAPFPADLLADVVARWPGAMVNIYGMTEGGVVCMLRAHEFPDKLHTVGQPVTGHQLIVLDEEDNRLPAGSKGILTGRSPTMMTGYRNQPEKTREMEWRDEEGNAWIKTGDIGVVDADGFVEIVGRSKDMIISGGFNIYPKDLEELLEAQPEVAEAAVVGIASEKWGETPVGFVRFEAGQAIPVEALRERVNAELGKTQRLSALHAIDEMPRSHIGKLLKTELREKASALALA